MRMRVCKRVGVGLRASADLRQIGLSESFLMVVVNRVSHGSEGHDASRGIKSAVHLFCL